MKNSRNCFRGTSLYGSCLFIRIFSCFDWFLLMAAGSPGCWFFGSDFCFLRDAGA